MRRTKKLQQALARAPVVGTCPLAPPMRVCRRIKAYRSEPINAIASANSKSRAVDALEARVKSLNADAKRIPGPLGLPAPDKWVIGERDGTFFLTKAEFDAHEGRYWDEIERVKGGRLVWFDRVLGALP